MHSKTPDGKPVVFLDMWSLVARDLNRYSAPERATCTLSGKAYNHPTHPHGKNIITSSLIKSQGQSVDTVNTHYVLGSIDPAYKEYLDEKGITLDELNPVKITGSGW
jgi:hypothetical protein